MSDAARVYNNYFMVRNFHLNHLLFYNAGSNFIKNIDYFLLILFSVLKNGDSLRISSCIIVPCAMFIAVTLFIEGIYRNMRGMNVLVTNIKWESLLSFDVSNCHLSREMVLSFKY